MVEYYKGKAYTVDRLIKKADSYKQQYLLRLTTHFNFLKKRSAQTCWDRPIPTKIVDKSSLRHSKCPSYGKGMERWTNSKRHAHRVTRRKVRILIHQGEDPDDLQYFPDPWQLW